MSIINGNGICILRNELFPITCYSKNNFAYTSVRLLGKRKSYEAFCWQLGFTSYPKTTRKDFVLALHLKFGCAGIDTLYYTISLLKYAISRSLITTVVNECNRCVSKTYFATKVTVDPNISTVQVVTSPADFTTPATITDQTIKRTLSATNSVLSFKRV